MLLQYHDAVGDAELRKSIVEVHRDCLWSNASFDDVVITTGGQQAVSLGLSAVFSSTCLLLQQPCYFGAIRYMKAYLPRVRIYTWTNTDDLIVLMHEHAHSAIYVTSNYAPDSTLPSCCISENDKEKIMMLARELSITIIEDNPYDITRYDYDGDDVHHTLASRVCHDDVNVLFIGGMSKVVGPALRIGFICANSKKMMSKLKSLKITGDLFTSPLCQNVCHSVLNKYDANGDSVLLAGLKSFLRSKRDAMMRTLEQHLSMFDRVSWNVPIAGVYIQLSWQPSSSCNVSLFTLFDKHGAIVDRSGYSYLDGCDRHHAKLNYAEMSDDNLDMGVLRLCAAFEEYYNGECHDMQTAVLKPVILAPKSECFHVLITSGGTCVPLDGVRVLTNISHGTTGACIAEEMLKRGHTVTYLYAKHSKRPFHRLLTLDIDHDDDEYERLSVIRNELAHYVHNGKLIEIEYVTYQQYYDHCDYILTSSHIDVAIFAAAVGDFGPDHQSSSKLSSDKDLTISLIRLPKIIKNVKQWAPRVFMVSFKLLVDVPFDEMIEVAYEGRLSAKSDIVVANVVPAGNLSIGSRRTVLITPEKGVTPTTTMDLPCCLCSMITRRLSHSHYRTKSISCEASLDSSMSVLDDVCLGCERLGYWVPYLKSEPNGREFGFVAIRLNEQERMLAGASDGFVITCRGSRKSQGGVTRHAVMVHHVDFNTKTVYVVENVLEHKASLNANVAASIFTHYPSLNVIVHAHIFPPTAYTTTADHAPGTQEDLDEVMACFRSATSARAGSADSVCINLINHGCIVTGSDWSDIKSVIGQNHTYRENPRHYDVTYERFLKSVNEFGVLVECHMKVPITSARVLDLAAGTGSVSDCLLSLGATDIVMCDASGGMLDVAVNKLMTKYRNVKLSTSIQRMQSLQFDESSLYKQPHNTRFDCCVCRQAINYAAVDVQGLTSVFTRIHDVLDNDGVFAFNAPNYDKSRHTDYTSISSYSYKSVTSSPTTGDTYVDLVEANSMDDDDRLLHHSQHCTIATLMPNSEEIQRESYYDYNCFTMFTCVEFVTALQSAGFKKIETFGKVNGTIVSPCCLSSKTLYVVAHK